MERDLKNLKELLVVTCYPSVVCRWRRTGCLGSTSQSSVKGTAARAGEMLLLPSCTPLVTSQVALVVGKNVRHTAMCLPFKGMGTDLCGVRWAIKGGKVLGTSA